MEDADKMPPEFREALSEIRNEFELFHDSPEPPLLFAWNIFWELRSSKNVTDKIQFTDIKAYGELYEIKFQPCEIKLIMHWDALFNSR